MTHLNYKRLAKKPTTFLRLTGTRLEEFKQISQRVKPLWEKEIEAKKKQAGRPSPLATFEDKLLVALIYYRTYVTHEFIGFLVGLHNANICRLLKRLEPFIARRICIKKDRSLTQEAVIKLLADVTEQPTQRPVKARKKRTYYSGKKKRHTLKTELIMEENGRILAVSKTHPGRRHDFRIRQASDPFPLNSEKYVDSGYQGLQKLTGNVMLPIKRRKNRPLTAEEKAHNRKLASFRIRIENKIREIKIFRIMAEIYRNFGRKHHLRFNIIAGIVNLKHAF